MIHQALHKNPVALQHMRFEATLPDGQTLGVDVLRVGWPVQRLAATS
jgi:hypothetical protein